MVQIKLEDTMSDFFTAEDHRTPASTSARKVLVLYNPVSELQEVQSGTALPPNKKYRVQQWRSSGIDDSSPVLNLILMPQRMAWIAGRMPVIFFTSNDQEEFREVKNDLAETIDSIDYRYRFEPTLCSSFHDISTVMGKDSVIIPYLPSDGVADLPHYINPDIHYELLSKRGLALSGIPTPQAWLVDFDPLAAGLSRQLGALEGEINRAISAIKSRSPPFVLKSNCAGGSKGTYLVRTLEEQLILEKEIAKLLRLELLQLNQDNAYLHPSSLILTELLPGQAVSLNFYVKNDGQPRFSSFCEQMLSDTGHWLGGVITYSEQRARAVEYADILVKASNFLFSRGYHGPAGIDVMSSAGGRHEIMDMNPRPTGSFVLGCLRPHFAEALALDVACVLPFIRFAGTRADFRTTFSAELDRGQVIVLAWFSDSVECIMCLSVGGEHRAAMEALCGDIKAWAADTILHK